MDLTVCKNLNGTTGCATFTSSCGTSNYPFATTFTSSGCFCVEPRMSFRVTNNSLSSVTINLVVTGSMGTYPLASPITLTSGASRDFASPADLDCDAQADVCP